MVVVEHLFLVYIDTNMDNLEDVVGDAMSDRDYDRAWMVIWRRRRRRAIWMMKIEREEKKEEVPAEEMNDDDGVKRRQGKDLEKGIFLN